MIPLCRVRGLGTNGVAIDLAGVKLILRYPLGITVRWPLPGLNEQQFHRVSRSDSETCFLKHPQYQRCQIEHCELFLLLDSQVWEIMGAILGAFPADGVVEVHCWRSSPRLPEITVRTRPSLPKGIKLDWRVVLDKWILRLDRKSWT